MQTSPEKRKRLFEDIYDLLIQSKWEGEARDNLTKFIHNKNVSWDGDNNTISIGAHFKIKLIEE